MNRIELEVPSGSTIHTVVEEIVRQLPSIVISLDVLMVAVNAEYASLSHTVKDGDEISFIPPVSGGFLDD